MEKNDFTGRTWITAVMWLAMVIVLPGRYVPRGRGGILGKLAMTHCLAAVLFVFVPAVLLVSTVLPARAATVTVDDGGTYTCDEAGFDAALAAANAGDTIAFDCNGGAATVIGVTTSKTISQNLTIDGGSNKITISGNSSTRVFLVETGGNLTLTGLTVANGSAPGGGSAIHNSGTLTATGCTFTGNSATEYGGGAVRGESGGVTTLNNCTLTGNSAATSGGAITILSGSTATISNCTVTGNTAPASGGGISVGGTLTIKNTIVANNGTSDLDSAGTVTSSYNIVEYPTGNYTATGTGDITGDQPNLNLGTLDYHGGVTKSYALLPGSVAINAGTDTGLTNDQRGEARAGLYDIGAYEYHGPEVVVSTDDSGPGTLRQAIADISSGGTITFHSTIAGGTITLTSGQFAIDKNLTIDGGSNNVTISGNSSFRVFLVWSGGNLTLTGLTVANGKADDGGGIRNSGTLTATGCTFTGNSTNLYGGGAVRGESGGVTTLNNCTLTGNSAATSGGAILIVSGSTATISNCTVTGNGDGIFIDGGTLTIKNTIVANNGTDDLNNNGGTVSSSYNIVETGYTSGTNDITGDQASLNLGSLDYHGGTTKTYALLPGSVAINAGISSGAPGTDQRGETRPQWGAHDIGAYEFVPPAENLVVDSNADTLDDDTGAGNNTLRDAIYYADAGDTIIFSGDRSIILGSQLTIDKNLTIDGESNNITVSGNSSSRVFNVTGGTLTLRNLSVIDGNPGNANGGGIYIDTASSLVAEGCTFQGNTSTSSFRGGAISHQGDTLTVSNCAFISNTAGIYGAISNNGTSANITNCTFYGNSSAFNAGDNGLIAGSGSGSIINCTFSGNSVTGTGSRVLGGTGTWELRNTVIANNTCDIQCGATTVSPNVNNLIEDGTCSPAVTGDPMLGSLAGNGGPTQTMALLAGSPAINAGTASGAPVTDQRGESRVGAHDIGAYEFQGPAVTTTAISAIANTTASGGGNVTDEGATSVTARGLCWGTSPNPTTEQTTDGAGAGSFTSSLSLLADGETYYVRAYATNGSGTGYGDEKSFTTTMTPPGNALNFDGSNDIADIGDTDFLDGVSQYTVEAWVRYEAFSNWKTAFGKRTSDSDRALILQCHENSGNIGIAVGMGYGYTSSPLSLNTWHHIAIVYNGGGASDLDRLKLYIDGGLRVLSFISTVPGTTPAGSDSRFVIGAEYNLTTPVSGATGVNIPFDGQIDEFRIWNTARSQAQIQADMHRELTGNGNEAGLLAYYNFNHISGTALSDISGNGNDGTLTSSPTWTASGAVVGNIDTAYQNGLDAIWDSVTDAAATAGLSLNGTPVGSHLVFGHNSASGTTAADVPAGEEAGFQRLSRVWQTDERGTVSATVTFDLSDAGGSALTGPDEHGLIRYVLLERTGTSGDFEVVQTADSLMDDQIIFGGVTAGDTFYTLGMRPDTAPEIAVPLSDVTVNEDALSMTVSLTGLFTDIDNDDAAIAMSVPVNSNPDLMSALVSDNVMTLTYAADMNGSADITVRGTSGGKTADDTFTVTVNPVDDAPEVANEIGDVTADEDADPTEISVDSVFTDIDSDESAIVMSVLTNTNPDMVTATVTDSILTLEYQPDQNGEAVITVQGTSDGKTAEDEFVVTVNPVDDAPYVANEIADVLADEDAPDTLIDLSSVFGDVDSDISAIVRTLLTNSSPDLLSANVAGNTLTLGYLPDRHGIAEITVQAESGGLTVTDTLTVTVNPVDDPPYCVGEVPPVQAVRGDPDTSLDLAEMFGDADNTAAEMTWAAESGDPALVAATVGGSLLTLAYQEGQTGETGVTVTVTSGGKTASCGFPVTVSLPAYTVSGKVTYYGSGIPVPGAVVTLETAEDSRTVTTDDAGAYSFPDITEGTEVLITPSREETPTSDVLSATDASDIAGAVLGRTELDGPGQKAADVTRNGRVTGMDASRLSRFSTGIITAMSRSPEVNPDAVWIFEPGILTLTVMSDTGALDFVTAMPGDLSGNWTPDSGRRSVRESGHIVEITADMGDELSVPIVLNEKTLIRGIDIVIEFDGDMPDGTDVTLAGGILEYEDYEMTVNREHGRTALAIFARSHVLEGSGTLVTLNLRVGQGNTFLAALTKFQCNEIPVSEEYDTPRDDVRMTGGFSVTGDIAHALRVTAAADLDKDDISGNRRLGMEDAILALQQGTLGTAIRILQCLTGR